MIYLIFDTNVWLYLANGLDPATGNHTENHFELLEKLELHTNKREIKVLINEIIISEFEKNKNHTRTLIQKLKNKLTNKGSVFNEIRKYSNKQELISKLEKEYLDGIRESIKLNIEHVSNVESFLKTKCIQIEIPDSLKIEIVDRALKKKAPFHNDKNNFADACILFSVDNYLSNYFPIGDYDRAFFISNNTSEFCQPNNSTKFHTEIESDLRCEILSYKRYLPSALKLSSALIAEMNEFYKEDDKFKYESFDCLFCDYNYYYTAKGVLNQEFKKVSDEMVFYDPNQLELFTDRPKSDINRALVKLGHCNDCDTPHIKCPHCDEIMIYSEECDANECEECGCSFSIDWSNSKVNIFKYYNA